MDLKTLLSLDIADQDKYYRDTYLQGAHEGRTTFLFFVRFFEDNAAKVLTASGETAVEYLKDLDLRFQFPETGMYNSPSGAWMFYRRPGRQMKKGICGHSCGWELFSAKFQRVFDRGVFKTFIHPGISFFNDSFLKEKLIYSLDAGLSELGKKKQLGFALNRTFVISHGVWSKKPTLWFRNVPIGEVTKNSILVYSPLFFQEAFDYFPKEGVECVPMFDFTPEIGQH